MVWMTTRLLISDKQVQALCQKVGFLKVICVSNVLMSMYGKCGGMYDARHVLMIWLIEFLFLGIL